MGLHICYELSLPAEADEAKAVELLSALRREALRLPFAEVSEFVRLTESDVVKLPNMRGLGFERLEDVVHIFGDLVRDELYREVSGADEESNVRAPQDLTTTIVGFAVGPGAGCEPAAFALVRLAPPAGVSRWFWHYCCKTQYASVVSEDHFLRCHASLVGLLERAAQTGIECQVRDETGFFESRDPALLLTRVHDMNRVVARFAGAFSDAFKSTGGESSQVQGEIFRHPDFERLETKD